MSLEPRGREGVSEICTSRDAHLKRLHLKSKHNPGLRGAGGFFVQSLIPRSLNLATTKKNQKIMTFLVRKLIGPNWTQNHCGLQEGS